MQSAELRTAVQKISALLESAGIRQAIHAVRTSKPEQKPVAVARLGQVGAVLVQGFDSLSDDESKLAKRMHLDGLASPDYWKALTADNKDPKAVQAELVRLTSRVTFAAGHLPILTDLLDEIEPPVVSTVPSAQLIETLDPMLATLASTESALFIRLTDAGERASDPDRVARAIDGVDMLYSACASITGKASADLRIDGIAARDNYDRTLIRWCARYLFSVILRHSLRWVLLPVLI